LYFARKPQTGVDLRMNSKLRCVALVMLLAFLLASCNRTKKSRESQLKAVQAPFASLIPTATFEIGKTADWVLVTNDSVWVAGSDPFSVLRIDPSTNKMTAKIPISGEACSGLAVGLGRLWVPVCGEKPGLIQIDLLTNKIAKTFPVGPAAPEGGIAVSADSVWLVTSKTGTLSRIDPKRGEVRQQVNLPHGSFNPIFSDGTIWVSGVETNTLTAVDASSGSLMASVPVGPAPRFLTAGSGSIWTLNQGDGSLSRVNAATRKLEATVALGTPGPGGDIDFGANSIWTTVFDVPLTQVDSRANKVVHQWVGTGGDSLRVGFGSVWLTNYKRGLLWRIPLPESPAR
jgi:virginiamycin B lyase